MEKRKRERDRGEGEGEGRGGGGAAVAVAGARFLQLAPALVAFVLFCLLCGSDVVAAGAIARVLQCVSSSQAQQPWSGEKKDEEEEEEEERRTRPERCKRGTKTKLSPATRCGRPRRDGLSGRAGWPAMLSRRTPPTTLPASLQQPAAQGGTGCCIERACPAP